MTSGRQNILYLIGNHTHTKRMNVHDFVAPDKNKASLIKDNFALR